MIKGIVAAVPKNIIHNTDEAFIKATGVRERRVVHGKQTVETLAEDAATRLLDLLHWDFNDIGAIIFVTQTPTVRMPAMACRLADRLAFFGPAFDINLACSGYVYGLWVASALAEATGGRVLLIAGDTVSRMTGGSEPGVEMLFGDACTATGIEASPHSILGFNLGTDGAGFDHLVADPDIRMDGAEVFNFALAEVPKLVECITMNAAVDWYFFHQANAMILNRIRNKCKLPEARVPMNIEHYGNTSSASIPLLMCDSAATATLQSQKNRVAMFGFGAGWSWGGCLLDLEPLVLGWIES